MSEKSLHQALLDLQAETVVKVLALMKSHGLQSGNPHVIIDIHHMNLEDKKFIPEPETRFLPGYGKYWVRKQNLRESVYYYTNFIKD